MSNMISIAEKLKNASHIKLYSPICGVCELYSIDYNKHIITTIDRFGTEYNFNFYGIYLISEGDESAECLLFPSKELRDWDSFSIKKEKEYNFKPFDKVIVRDNYGDNVWKADFFSHINTDDEDGRKYSCVSTAWEQCLPYNEETAKLIGTTDDYE